MTEIIQFGILGISAGVMLALSAVGVVVVYRGSRVLNLAHGSIGAVGTFTYWQVSVGWGAPYVVGLLSGIAMSAAVGLLVYGAVIRPMGNASVVSRVVGTLAVVVVLQAGMQLLYGSNLRTVPSELPRGTWTIGDIRIGQDRLILIAIALILFAALAVFYRRSAFGRETNAVAENVVVAAILGIRVGRVAAINWALGSALSGLSGILLAPIIGVQIAVLTQSLVAALAAALLGRLTSFSLTLLGGVVIGIAQAEVTRYVSTPGWAAAIPLIVLVVVMSFRSDGVQLRSALRERKANVGSGRIRWKPVGAVAVVVLVLIWAVASVKYVNAMSVLFAVAVILLSCVVVTGYAGQISVAQFTLAGIGAVIAGRLVCGSLGLNMIWAMVIAAVIMFPVGILIGLPALRSRGVNLAIMTMSVALTVQEVLFLNNSWTKGSVDAMFTPPPPSIFGWKFDAFENPRGYATVALVVLFACALFVAALRRSRFGRQLLALRSNERAASAVGINVASRKLLAFGAGSSLAAIGGVVLVFQQFVLTYDSGFDVFSSINGLVYTTLGGIGYIFGPIIGALAAPGSVVGTIFSSAGDKATLWVAFIGGIMTIHMLIVAPDGAFKLNADLVKRLTRRFRQDPDPDLAGVFPPAREVSPLTGHRLDVEGLVVKFGGVTAVDGVNLTVESGRITGLLGPNGAGKSTVIDAVTGYVSPQSGTVSLDGRKLNSESVHRRVKSGLGRTFQSLELFDEMTVEDNIRTAAEVYRSAVKGLLGRGGDDPVYERAAAVVEAFELTDDLHRHPTELPYGRRRLVAIARAIAGAQTILCLDEPAAGLGSVEARELGTMLKKIAMEWGVGVLLVEHNVELMMEVCDTITAIEFGKHLATGTPQEIRQHPDVVRAYLGEATESETDDARLTESSSL
ncbi:branched-chain amino acid ABC transporter permease/ATP-binding protein [Rhodococcus sp. T2V]|uniref:branched-chain amino acid ABC transporter permease/ATP-binding protein n=1 Tax=Rhodococcus sp. T2V TaxID=3034164 RepID=UPI0023E2D2C8|nr:branched-chain amino acid ABC transporter permease/ATP-binding protein [Rhodococcus sp. T2V]MDF3313220.1 branched-chain amino acid ABC transporter permease/ATP-binding protein [Rhodococcus sp. T2V]